MNWLTRLLNITGLGAVPHLRKLIVGVIGSTVVLVGVALIVLPGPAFLVIPAGLVILASEFAWARRLIRRGRTLLEKVKRTR